jgi:hypothetical protein
VKTVSEEEAALVAIKHSPRKIVAWRIKPPLAFRGTETIQYHLKLIIVNVLENVDKALHDWNNSP